MTIPLAQSWSAREGTATAEAATTATPWIHSAAFDPSPLVLSPCSRCLLAVSPHPTASRSSARASLHPHYLSTFTFYFWQETRASIARTDDVLRRARPASSRAWVSVLFRFRPSCRRWSSAGTPTTWPGRAAAFCRFTGTGPARDRSVVPPHRQRRDHLGGRHDGILEHRRISGAARPADGDPPRLPAAIPLVAGSDRGGVSRPPLIARSASDVRQPMIPELSFWRPASCSSTYLWIADGNMATSNADRALHPALGILWFVHRGDSPMAPRPATRRWLTTLSRSLPLLLVVRWPPGS